MRNAYVLYSNEKEKNDACKIYMGKKNPLKIYIV